MAWPFEDTRAGYGKLWGRAAVKPGLDSQNADRFADIILANEQRYRAVQQSTGVPWFFIAALHMRESSCNFAGVLHNGEKIIGTDRLTTLVPAGRGPFASWEEAAVDALKLKDLHRIQEWPVERMLHSAEVFNGLGYVGKGVNSPYVWAGTTEEQTGKYVADHVFDRSAEDTQLGVAAVLKRLAERRADIAAVLHSTTPPPTGGTVPVVIGRQLDLGTFIASAVALYQRSQQPGGLQQQDLIAFMQPLVSSVPQPLLPPVLEQPKPPVTPPGGTPILERPSVLAGGAAFLAGLIAQLNGNIAPPIGETATLPGILTTSRPMATMFLGGPLGGLLSGLLGKLGPVLTNMSNKS